MPTDTGRDPWIAASLAVLIPAAYVSSFIFLTRLAVACGWPWWTAWLLPLTVDALATAAWRIYWTTGRDRLALTAALLATVAGVVGNAAAHLYATGQAAPGWLAVALVASTPPIAIGLVVIMDARRPRLEQPAPADRLEPVEVAEPAATIVDTPPGSLVREGPGLSLVDEPAPSPAPRARTPRTPRRAPEQLAAEILNRRLGHLSGDALAAELHVSKNDALKAKRLAAGVPLS